MAPPKSEFSERFQTRMLQAMEVSYHKYGKVSDAYPLLVNAIESLKKRLRLYEETGNQDYLVDIANFAMIEFMHPAHTDAHDSPTDGGEGRIWHSGGRANENDNKGETQRRRAYDGR